MFSLTNTQICERNKLIDWFKEQIYQMAHIFIFE
jgi:hypothetical protein